MRILLFRAITILTVPHFRKLANDELWQAEPRCLASCSHDGSAMVGRGILEGFRVLGV